MIGLALSGTHWDAMAAIPCEVVQSDGLPPQALFDQIALYIQVTSATAQNIARHATRQADLNLTTLNRPAAFMKLKDIFKAGIEKGKTDTDPK